MVTEAPVGSDAPVILDTPVADVPQGEPEESAPVSPSPLDGLDDDALDALPEVAARIERVRAEAKRESDEAVAAAARDKEAEVGERYTQSLRDWVDQGKYVEHVNTLIQTATSSGKPVTREQLDEIVGGVRIDTGLRYDDAYHEHMIKGLPADYGIPASEQVAIDAARKALARNENGARIKLWDAITDVRASAKAAQVTAKLRSEIETQVRAEMETKRMKEAEDARAKASSPTRAGNAPASPVYETLAAAAAAYNSGELSHEAFRAERKRFGIR